MPLATVMVILSVANVNPRALGPGLVSRPEAPMSPSEPGTGLARVLRAAPQRRFTGSPVRRQPRESSVEICSARAMLGLSARPLSSSLARMFHNLRPGGFVAERRCSRRVTTANA